VGARVNHDDCTCCRHCRKFESQRSAHEERDRQVKAREGQPQIIGEGPEFEAPVGLLGP